MFQVRFLPPAAKYIKKVRTMTYEARCAAEGKCEYETYEDVFGTEK